MEETALLFGTLNSDNPLITTTPFIFTGSGADILDVSNINNEINYRLYSGQDNDQLLAGNNDYLFGGIGNDTLDATNGMNNRLYGGEGDDILFAGFGNNFLAGGSGIDRFIIAKENLPENRNIIVDFVR